MIDLNMFKLRHIKMKQINLWIVVAGLIFSSSVMATDGNEDNFSAEKDREIKNIRDRMQISEGRLNCLQAAKDMEALKSCNQAADKKMDALEAKIKAEVKAQAPDNKATPNPKHLDNKHPDTKNKQN